MSDGRTSERIAVRPAAVARATLVVAAVVVLILLAWQLADVLLLTFAAILLAIALRSLARPIERHTPLTPLWSLALSGLLLAAVASVLVVFLGAQIYAQVSGLIERLPDLISSVGNRLGIEDLGERLTERVADFAGSSGVVGRIAGYTSGFVSGVANAVLVIVAGAYLAANPGPYRRGVLQLMPDRTRAEAARLLDNVGNALQLWLLGQLASMAIVGVLITLGLYMIGTPSALALGFLAAILEFVPIVGPVLSAVPAILLALSEGGAMVFWVTGLYVVVQQLESNIILPVIQRRAVDLPAVVTLFAILSFGVVFGPLGVLLGTPLTVVAFVAVKQLYVRDALGEETKVPGENR